MIDKLRQFVRYTCRVVWILVEGS